MEALILLIEREGKSEQLHLKERAAALSWARKKLVGEKQQDVAVQKVGLQVPSVETLEEGRERGRRGQKQKKNSREDGREAKGSSTLVPEPVWVAKGQCL